MRAKACTKCRQWKVRCDASEAPAGGCSRCQSLKLPCVFDASFKRTSRSKHLQQMSTEIQQLRQALQESTPGDTPSRVTEHESNSLLPNWVSPLSAPVAEIVEPKSCSVPLQASPFLTRTTTSIPYRILGDVTLTAGQVSEHFRKYFTTCHQYLPFKMKSNSAEDIYLKSPLLFWVICAATSNRELRSRLAPMIRTMVADAIYSISRSVETVQALLILCIWPFSFTRLRQDPSFFLSGLAVQMGQQLGIHCPTQAYSHLYGLEKPSTVADNEVKLSTWLACYVVNQIQSSSLGVPPALQADFHLLKAFDHKSIDRTLSRICRIYHLLTQSNLAIGASGSTPSGLLDPEARLVTVTLFGEQFSALQARHLEPMNDVVKITFLKSRLQVWSFVLLDDMPMSSEVLKIMRQAEDDACELIEICSSRNLSVAPYDLSRAISYAAFILVKILRSSQVTQYEVLEDKIESVRQILATTANSEGDILHKTSLRLRELLYLEDRKLSPPILSRMGMSFLYNFFRIYMENNYLMNQETQTLDLDGIDWDDLSL